MQALPTPRNDVYLGRGGSGKSTLLRHVLRNEKRVMIFDMAREPANAAGAVVVETKSALVDALRTKRFRVCVRKPSGAKAVIMFDWMNRAAMEVGDCFVIWEEVNTIFKHSMPQYAEEIMHQGRHQRVRLSLVARRPVYLTDPLNLATTVNIFSTTGASDRKKLATYVGNEAAEATARLAARHYVQWTEHGWKICNPVKISSRRVR